MSYAVTWEAHGAYKYFSGHVSFAEYAHSQEEILGDARADEIRYVINDLRDVESYTVTQDEAEYSAAFNRASAVSNPRVRIAYVTSDTKIRLLIGMAKILSSYEIKAFDSLGDARAWCGATP